MSDCNHDCSSCAEKCEKKDFMAKPLDSTHIGKIIAVMSGKGGVGKSMVTDLLATAMARKGYRTAILDADITGPSVPKAFGITEQAYGNADGTVIYPVESAQGIKIMSMNLLLPEETDPVVWRGPVISGAVKQFYTDVLWEEVDYMFVDMPPGTGDVPLTVFQSLPIDGIVVVTTPQELVSMIVGKAVKMAEMMKIKIYGIVENMSYVECPHCGEKIYPFGKDKTEKAAESYSLPVIGRLPVDPKLSSAVDEGRVEEVGDYLSDAATAIEKG
ncbi:MAG: Mrp/NBP35 family ATP-binding protein [Clostridia bacterium]|nr:Mrp/NBP35 family ATP-binding protein [Clostridia bacterium]